MSTDDVFNTAAQSKFISNFGVDLSKNIKQTTVKRDNNALNPVTAIDSMVKSLKLNGADSDYIEAMEELKTDPDILKAVEHFEKSLNGEANMHDMRKVVPPETPAAETKPTIDVGLNGEVFTGKIDDNKDNDLIRYSNYISGAGTSFGGFMTDIPSTLHDLADQALDLHLRDYTKWEGKLEEANNRVSKIMQDEVDFHDMYGDNPRRMIDRSKTADMQGGTTKRSLAEIQAQTHVGKKKIAVAQHELYSKKMMDVSTKKSGAMRAKSMLDKVGGKIGYASTAFTGIQGGIDISAGSQMLSNAKERLEKGEINEDEYNRLKRDAELRITGGAFGIGSGIYDMGKIVQEKIGKKVAKKLASKGVSMSKHATKMLARFGSMVGGAISIAMGVVSMTKNAIAADAARRDKNYGRMAMYGIMAALDGVSIALDAISVVLDFIPGIGTAISVIVDLVNTVVGLVNMVIGFFADMVDTRSDEDKVKAAFDDYVESAAFKAYIDRQAEVYKKQGYDLFQYIVDAEAAGISESDYDSSKVDKTVTRKLTDKAVEDSTDRSLRLALIDASSIGRELRGRAGDDLIMAGVGADTVFGEEGDDLLYGEKGNNTLYGGPGNDYLNGGTGRNELFGGEGDDWMVVKPGLDKLVDGGAGSDTVEISADFFNWYKHGSQNTIKLGFGPNHVQGCYVDLSAQNNSKHGRAGLALGGLINNISELDRPDPIHKKAFTHDSSLERDLKSLMAKGGSTISNSVLSGKMLWFLAHDVHTGVNTDLKYVTDGEYIYTLGRSEGRSGSWRSEFSINTIPKGVAQYNESTMSLTYNPGKELEALFLFAFRGTECVKNVEKIVESKSSIDIHSQVIGDNKKNLFDIMYGYNEYVYTGNGNNVVIMASSFSPAFEMWKYIIGGDGDNTLIINSSSRSTVPRSHNGMNYDAGHVFMLLEADIELSKANKSYNPSNVNAWKGNTVDRGIYLKNVKRIQLSAQFKHNASFFVDATNLKSGHSFIIDSDTSTFRLVGTPGDDTIYVKNLAQKSSYIDGFGGTNLLNMENYESNDVLAITLGDQLSGGMIKGTKLTARLKNIQSIKASYMVKSIEGNNQDNLLIASGGETTVSAKGGRNTLVSMRGCHTFEGGDDGINTYMISGPDITETTTVTVTNVHNVGLRASSLLGSWTNGILTVNVLKNEPATIRLTQANIVDASGSTVSNKGSLTIENNKLVFRIRHYFSHLKDHEMETIRVKYTTTGSTATINEPGVGCVLRLSNFSNAAELHVFVNSSNQLEFQTLTKQTIFVDKYWAKAFTDGITSPISLISMFGRRFQMIVFEKSKEVLDYKGIFAMLKDKLSSIISDATNNYDHLIDLAEIAQTHLTQYTLGDGSNKVLMSVRNIKLQLGKGSSLVDVSGTVKQTAALAAGTTVAVGSGKTTLILGTGRETVTIEGSSNKSICLIFKNIDSNSVAIQESYGPTYELRYSGSLVTTLKRFVPVKMCFLHNGVMVIVDDVPAYITQRKMSKPYTHLLELADGKSKLRLRIPNVSSASLKISVAVTKKGIKVSFVVGNDTVFEFLSFTTELNADYIAMETRYQLQGGVVMSDGTKIGQALQDLVKGKLGSGSDLSVLKASQFDEVVSLSQKNTPQLTLKNTSEMVIANKSGYTVNTSGGNDFVRVSASNVTVQTGEGRDTVFVQSGATGVSVVFKASDNVYVAGRNTLVIEGVTGSNVTLSNQNDGKLSSQAYENKNIPVKFKKDSTLVQIDKSPSCLMFKNGSEYEVIPFSRVSQFFADQAQNRYIARNFIGSDGKMFLKAADIRSSDFQISIWRSSSGYTSVRFFSAAVFNIHARYTNTDSTTASGTDLVLDVASEFPGGVMFQDGMKKDGSLLVFLLGKMVAATVSGISVTSSSWSDSDAKTAYDEYMKTNDNTKDYTTIVANVALSLTV